MDKTILGLDLGTNSIGWALINQDFDKKEGKILGMGSRIIPMSQDILGEFGKGNSVSQTASRTGYRGVRRLRERFLLRRERLHRVLNLLQFLPEHFASQIDFEKRFGKFKEETEPKLVYDKNEFIFKSSFEEMLSDFQKHQPQLLENYKKVPYDWTIYYLRNKALTQKIEKEELAWILLNFNQKRGYYQLRGEEEEENPNKLVEFYSLTIVDVLADEPQKGKSDIWYSLILENGWIYRRSSKTPLFDWKDKTRDFIVTTDLNDDGSVKTDKDGDEKRSFRAPSENDWTLVKKKTENEIDKSKKTVGTYIYNALLQNPKQKINGKLVRTIERKFYKEELKKILERQQSFHPELKNDDLYNDCVRELYRNNEAHQLTLSKKDFVHLFMEDIIFYQRPLRSQKSSISNCTLEFRKYKDENGVEHTQYLKAIPKSNPYYQEFRTWQWMYNLNIYKRDDDTNVTHEFLKTTEDFENLFEFLNNRKEVDQKALLKHFKLNEKTHRWNFVEDKKYPCNETKTMISSRLDKVENISDDFLTREIEQKIWHIIYSVNDKIEYEKALKSFANKNNLDEVSFIEAFKKFSPFKSEYGSFSEKAIKKLLPLMRLGKYWNYEDINDYSKDRIQKIITGEFDENIKDKVREKAINLTTENHFQGLQLWFAQYIVYGRHSEASLIGKWNSADDLEEFLKEFKQHSLRNPIVEQVITETLRVVKDIWVKYGNGAKEFFDEIHIELGREMKNTADDRKRITNTVTENENTNLRIKALLAEMMNDHSVENVRPYSPMQQEILKIYEDGILKSDIEIEDDILKISKTAQPSSSDLKRYKLWLEQKYKSPYTGQIIPLNKLFTPEYEIEHIIPQSRYFDDSFSNKIICESAVNKLKDNYIGLGFIKQFHGYKISDKIKIFEVDEYEDFVKKHYANNRGKRIKLLLEEIPEKMIERQLNDTRHISKYISGVLSNIVRVEDGSDEGVNSKNIVPGNGKISNQLKQDWGLNDVWNELILPRFERMNELTNSTDFTAWNENHQKFLPTVPIEYSKGFSKKRIDHRHHALDALVIACATKDHVNLLNNQSAKSDTKRYDLKKKLMKFEKAVYNHPQTGERIEREVPKQFLKPWNNFTVDAKNNLETIIVSFKQNLRVINKATNHYEKWIEKDGAKVKERVEQKGINWAIRKSLHEETVSGKIYLPWVETSKGEFITATRKSLDSSFTIDKIGKITDTGIQKILKNYFEAKDRNPELAFSPEGIEDLNKNIEKYNDGKLHQPIIKVRLFEKGKGRFALGQTGNKVDKYVQGSPNLYFAIYKDEQGKRSYESIRLDVAIERMKQMLNPVPELNNNGLELFQTLSPLDLIYIPTDEEIDTPEIIDFDRLDKSQIERLYNTNDFSGYTIYFSQNSFSKNIFPKEMDMTWNEKKQKPSGSFDSKTASFKGKSIKENFIKLTIDRLGNISKA
jgi:CRISPR-associated endonuclease Csn1